MHKSRPSAEKRIALIGVPLLLAHSRFNAALTRYTSEEVRWRAVFSVEASASAFRFLRQLNCDGALVRIVSPAMARHARRVPFPLVNFSAWLEKPGVPTVRRDEAAMGRLCAEHLLNKGFRRFGIVVMKGGWFIKARCRSFIESVKKAGFGAGVEVLTLHSHPVNGKDLERYKKWLATLQTPAAVFLTDDEDAAVLMAACRGLGRRIPQDLAFIAGLGHPERVHACVPPLSHADEDEEGVALEAARYLQRLMTRESRENRTIVLPPKGVVGLASTDTVAVDDPELAQAVEYLRAHAPERINIKDVAQHVSISRVTLERRFRRMMGTSLHDFLVRERLARAQELLRTQPDLHFKEVARRCGFANGRRLNLVFRRVLGILPGACREKDSRKAPPDGPLELSGPELEK